MGFAENQYQEVVGIWPAFTGSRLMKICEMMEPRVNLRNEIYRAEADQSQGRSPFLGGKTMNDELKPVKCGCGGEAVIYVTHWWGKCYVCECDECGTASRPCDTEAEAIEAWNRAMGADKVDELIEHIWREKLDTREAIANLVKRMLK